MPKKDIDNKTWVHKVSSIDGYVNYSNDIAVADLNRQPDHIGLDGIVMYDVKGTIDYLVYKSNPVNPLFNAIYNSLTEDVDDICLNPDDDYYEEDDPEYYYGTSWFKVYIRALRSNIGRNINLSCRRWYRQKDL